MRIFLNAGWLTFALTFAIQFVVFLRWIYRRIRNDEITRVFVHDMATNHLPHIYDRLDQQGIERAKPSPPIRWLDLNGKTGN